MTAYKRADVRETASLWMVEKRIGSEFSPDDLPAARERWRKRF
jgi:hypothetical protein